MEGFVFFNTDNASVLHYNDYSRGFDGMQKLAMDSYSLLITSSFTLKSISNSNKLICFAKDPYHPLALALEFAENVTTEIDGSNFAELMLQLFMQQFGHILHGKASRKFYKSYNKSLKQIIDQVLEPIMEKIADYSKADFLYLTFLKNFEKSGANMKTFLLSPSSSMNTDMTGIDRLPILHKREIAGNTPQQLVYRLYPKEKVISPQVINVINTVAVLGNEMMETVKDELQLMELCMGNSLIKAIKFNEMLLVISVKDQVPSMKQVKQLYSWAKFLIA